MPYTWTTQPSDQTQIMKLKPYDSLPVRSMATFVMSTFTLILIPAIALLGTPVFWGLLPFELLTVWGLYFALQQNHKQRQITEVLTLSKGNAQLTRKGPKGDIQTWECNRYWTQVNIHETDGPVPYYVTLKGMGREVEIGAFLSEKERITLYDDLSAALKKVG